MNGTSRGRRARRFTYAQVAGTIAFWTVFTAAAAWVVWNLVLPGISAWTG